jgi:poly-gamma-glutamate capsule biosynthesis protein CapA/YwtB (metallophosphatase superfamily)
VLVAGGDVELGRFNGKRILREPGHDPLSPLARVLGSGDVRFVNLESQLSEQGGETMSPRNNLVFTGPPRGAEVLARAGIDVVSTANNHAWDYGKRALLETLDNLDRAGVLHAGTGTDLARACAPAIVERAGLRVAFLAATDVWNQGPLSAHEGSAFVAGADEARLVGAVAALKKGGPGGAELVAVSYHGGEQYQDAPSARARRLHRALIDAGADVVIGHHPHVMQGVEWYRGRPILYSLGNLLMAMHSDHPWTGMSFLARLRLRPGQRPELEVCPYRILGHDPRALIDDPARGALFSSFSAHLQQISAGLGGLRVGALGDDGCAPVEAAPAPAMPAPAPAAAR